MSLVVHQPFAATVHNQSATFSGNTAGVSTWSGTNLIMSAGNNVTWSITGDTLGLVASGSWVLSAGAGISLSTTGGTIIIKTA